MIKKSDAAHTVVAHQVDWSPVDAVLWLFVAFLAPALVTVAYVGARYGGSLPDEVSALDLLILQPALWLSYLLGPWYTARRKGAGFKIDYGATLKAIDVPTGIVAGVVTQLVLLRGLYWVIAKFVDGDPSAAARELVEPMSGVVDWSILTFAVVIMAPVVEEFFFRGLLLRSVQRASGVGPAILISGLVFAAVHMQALQFPGLFVVGAIAATMAIWTGRLGLPIMFHLGFNAAGLATLYFETH